MGFTVAAAALVFALVSAAGATDSDPDERARVLPAYDHHVHLLSPQLIAHWKSLGVSFGRADDAYTNPAFLIDGEQLRGAFIVSMAHLYATEWFDGLGGSPEERRRWLAAENDFIASCAATAPGLVGFFSVCPSSDGAFDEMNRCRENPDLTGLKLHLPACGVDLNDAAHAKRLGEVLAWAGANDVPVLLHLTAGEPVTAAYARRFWEEIVAPRTGLELYLAHLGSAGGYGDATREILDAFVQVRARIDGFGDRVYFDLSGAIIPEGSEEASPTSDADCARLAGHMREVGIDRFVFASDYPVFGIQDSARQLRARLALTDAELRQLFENHSPRFTRR